jgi:hypothetical protein
MTVLGRAVAVGAPYWPDASRRSCRSSPGLCSKATTASVIGAAATLLWKRNACSPKPARYGWAAYQARVGCALAADGVLVRDAARLRLLQLVDAVVVHAAALTGPQRTVVEAYPSVEEWDHAQLCQAAARALTTTDVGPTDVWLRPAPDDSHADTGLMIASAQGQDVGTVPVDYQPDPLAQAVLDAARRAGLRIVVVEQGAGQHAGLADEVIGPVRPPACRVWYEGPTARRTWSRRQTGRAAPAWFDPIGRLLRWLRLPIVNTRLDHQPLLRRAHEVVHLRPLVA